MDTNIKSFGAILLLTMMLLSSVATAAEAKRVGKLKPVMIYTGSVAINKVGGTIELRDGVAPVINLNVSIKNNAKENKNITIGFRNTDSSRMTLKKQAASVVRLTPVVRYKGHAGKVQMASIDLSLLVDGLLPAKPVAGVDIKIKLPAAAKKIIRSNLALRADKEGGRSVYYLQLNGKYLTRLNLVYTTGPVVLDIKKAITPAKITKGNVHVTLTVKNEGTQTANNVLLEDNYDSRDFSAEGEDFLLYKGVVNDSRLVWRKVMPSLAAGETKSISYTITANYEVKNTMLSAATASVNKELVGVSNKIRLGND